MKVQPAQCFFHKEVYRFTSCNQNETASAGMTNSAEQGWSPEVFHLQLALLHVLSRLHASPTHLHPGAAVKIGFKRGVRSSSLPSTCGFNSSSEERMFDFKKKMFNCLFASHCVSCISAGQPQVPFRRHYTV